MRSHALGRVLTTAALTAAAVGLASAGQTGLRFAVTLDASLPAQPPGRLVVVMVPAGQPGGEPRFRIGDTGRRAVPTLGVDAPPLAPGDRVTVGAGAAAFPIEKLGDLPAGEYRVQAVLATNRDIRRVDAPGNLYGDIRRVELDPGRPAAIDLRLTQRIPDERLPDDTGLLRFFRASPPSACPRSTAGPIHLRAGVILPHRATTRTRRAATRCACASAATAPGTPGCSG